MKPVSTLWHLLQVSPQQMKVQRKLRNDKECYKRKRQAGHQIQGSCIIPLVTEDEKMSAGQRYQGRNYRHVECY